jgi:hypothetical protein
MYLLTNPNRGIILAAPEDYMMPEDKWHDFLNAKGV